METQPVAKFLGPALRLVRIEWEGPVSFTEAIQRGGIEDYGLYMVEGHNLLYGCKGGLYFGIACDQTFATRMKQHEWWIKLTQNVTIRFGRPWEEDYEKEAPSYPDWQNLVVDVEALTIYWHSFPYNSSHIGTYTGRALRIQNRGNRGNLQIEYSSDWRPPRPLPELEQSDGA